MPVFTPHTKHTFSQNNFPALTKIHHLYLHITISPSAPYRKGGRPIDLTVPTRKGGRPSWPQSSYKGRSEACWPQSSCKGRGGRRPPAAPPASPSHPTQGSSSWVVPLAQLHSSSRNFPSHFHPVSLPCGSFPACRTCPVTVRALGVISPEITRIYLSDVRRSSCVRARRPNVPAAEFPFLFDNCLQEINKPAMALSSWRWHTYLSRRPDRIQLLCEGGRGEISNAPTPTGFTKPKQSQIMFSCSVLLSHARIPLFSGWHRPRTSPPCNSPWNSLTMMLLSSRKTRERSIYAF